MPISKATNAEPYISVSVGNLWIRALVLTCWTAICRFSLLRPCCSPRPPTAGDSEPAAVVNAGGFRVGLWCQSRPEKQKPNTVDLSLKCHATTSASAKTTDLPKSRRGRRTVAFRLLRVLGPLHELLLQENPHTIFPSWAFCGFG